MNHVEQLPDPPHNRLIPADQAWLGGFGVAASWWDNPTAVAKMNRDVQLGCTRLFGPGKPELHQDVSDARNRFYSFVGFSPTDLRNTDNSKFATPTDTFIGGQREMQRLGLDGADIVKRYPSAANTTDKTINRNYRFIRRTATLFTWEHDAHSFVQRYPLCLATNIERLQILRRLMATHATADPKLPPSRVRSTLFCSMEIFLLALDDERPTRTPAELIHRAQKHLHRPSAERKRKAKQLAENGNLGRIGTMYLEHTDEWTRTARQFKIQTRAKRLAQDS